MPVYGHIIYKGHVRVKASPARELELGRDETREGTGDSVLSFLTSAPVTGQNPFSSESVANRFLDLVMK